MKLEEVIKLIKTVSEYPWLWNPNHLQFNDAILENESWEYVAAEVGGNPNDCRLEWEKVSNSYLAALLSTTSVPKFICRLHKHFKFFLPVVNEGLKKTDNLDAIADVSQKRDNVPNKNKDTAPEDRIDDDEKLLEEFNDVAQEAHRVDNELVQEATARAKQLVSVDRSHVTYEWMSFFWSNMSDILALEISNQRKLKRIIIEQLQKLHEQNKF